MRDMRHGVCPLCEHNEIIQADATEWAGETERRRAAIRYAAVHEHGPLIVPIGPLVSYVCRACGFVQFFAERPGEIPIDDAYGTRLLEGPQKSAPYR